jgi:HAD superfamily phosphatase (TIGR01668 family)
MSNFLTPPRPTFIVKNVEALTPDFMHANDIKLSVFDVDGAIGEYHSSEKPPMVTRMMNDLRDSGILLAINSNAYGHRVDQLEDMYDEVTDGNVITPASLAPKGEDPRKFRKPNPAMLAETGERFGVDPTKILMVGDQLLKDIWAANRAGAKSLLVPRRGRGDFLPVRSNQSPAEWVLRRAMGLPIKWPDAVEAVGQNHD